MRGGRVNNISRSKYPRPALFLFTHLKFVVQWRTKGGGLVGLNIPRLSLTPKNVKYAILDTCGIKKCTQNCTKIFRNHAISRVRMAYSMGSIPPCLIFQIITKKRVFRTVEPFIGTFPDLKNTKKIHLKLIKNTLFL